MISEMCFLNFFLYFFFHHACILECDVCHRCFHLNCISLNKEERTLVTNDKPWYCPLGIRAVFPFNHIEEDRIFISAMSDNKKDGFLFDLTNYDCCLPFEATEENYNLPIFEHDPDNYYYNDFNIKMVDTCKYYTEDKFNSDLQNVLISSAAQLLSLCHFNIRSTVCNLGVFEQYLETLNHSFTAIGITETWFKDNNADLYTLQGYNVVEKHRVSKRGGGVAVYIKQGIHFTQRVDLSVFNDSIETVFIEIDKFEVHSETNIIVGVIYRPHNTDMKLFSELMTDVFERLQRENKLSYLMGDYNLDLLKHEIHPQTSNFLDIIYSYNYIPLITRPTRRKEQSGTLIDNIFTNNLAELGTSIHGLLVTDISDHLPIFIVNFKLKERKIDTVTFRRKYSMQNKNKFLNLIAEVEWGNIYNHENTSLAFKLFHSKLTKLFNEAFPKVKHKSIYYARKPWLTQALKKSINVKKIDCM